MQGCINKQNSHSSSKSLRHFDILVNPLLPQMQMTLTIITRNHTSRNFEILLFFLQSLENPCCQYYTRDCFKYLLLLLLLLFLLLLLSLFCSVRFIIKISSLQCVTYLKKTFAGPRLVEN